MVTEVVCLAQEASTGLVDNPDGRAVPKRWRYHGEDHPYSSLLARLRTVLAEKESATLQADEGKLPRRDWNRLRNEQTSASQSRSWLAEHQCIAKNKTSLRRCAVTLVAVVSNGLSGALISDLGLWDGDCLLSCYRALLEEYGDFKSGRRPGALWWVERTDLERSSSAEPESSSSEAPVSQKNAGRYMAARLTSLHSCGGELPLWPHCWRSWSRGERQRPHACYLSQCEPLRQLLVRNGAG